mmetsp:Transcript_8725/g.20886  ORF Transcript_8725/g.20886 Transcript_8725/m.20886 type:complete len:161 (+) Transcript_8725:300-782(+)
MWITAMYNVFTPFQMGKHIGSTLVNAARSVAQMDELKQEDQACLSRMFCQSMANLSGQSDETVVLQGIWFQSIGWTPQSETLYGELDFHRLILFVFFGDYEAAADLALANGNKFEKNSPGTSFTLVIRALFFLKTQFSCRQKEISWYHMKPSSAVLRSMP